MNAGSNHLATKILLHRFTRSELLLLVAGAIGFSMALLFAPYFRSLWRWSGHRAMIFEGNLLPLPMRWVHGERGHLLSIRQPGRTLLLPYESEIVIDPFAEHWPVDKVSKVSADWLALHGSSASGKFRDSGNGDTITFVPTMKCVSRSSSSQRHDIEIYCLSLDSIHSFEFFGERDAIADFAEVVAQASRIAAQHPGSILRK